MSRIVPEIARRRDRCVDRRRAGGVEHVVESRAARRDGAHRRGVRLAIIEGAARAQLLGDAAFAVAAAGRVDLRAAPGRELHRDMADSSRAPLHEDRTAGLQVVAVEIAEPRGDGDEGQGGGLLEGEGGRFGRHHARIGRHELRQRAGLAADAGSEGVDRIAFPEPLRAGADRAHDAGAVGMEDRRQARAQSGRAPVAGSCSRPGSRCSRGRRSSPRLRPAPGPAPRSGGRLRARHALRSPSPSCRAPR